MGDDVGKAKPTCYDLPPEEFAYGRPNNPDFEGAREVTMQWLSHVPGPRPEEKVQDFRKINKLALRGGVSSAKDLAEFRRNNATNVTLAGPQHLGPPPKVIPSDVVPSFTYGKKTRPSTPIASVVSYQFASEYEEDIGTKYEMDRQQKEYNAQIRKIPSTLAAKGHGKAAQKGQVDNTPKELFKISKFKRVQ